MLFKFKFPLEIHVPQQNSNQKTSEQRQENHFRSATTETFSLALEKMSGYQQNRKLETSNQGMQF